MFEILRWLAPRKHIWLLVRSTLDIWFDANVWSWKNMVDIWPRTLITTYMGHQKRSLLILSVCIVHLHTHYHVNWWPTLQHRSLENCYTTIIMPLRMNTAIWMMQSTNTAFASNSSRPSSIAYASGYVNKRGGSNRDSHIPQSRYALWHNHNYKKVNGSETIYNARSNRSNLYDAS